MWQEVLERFEQQARIGVMARVALERALPAGWIDEVGCPRFSGHIEWQHVLWRRI